MVIQLPPMCGMQTHPNLLSKVEGAIARQDFPVDFDCASTSFTTSMFCRFVIKVNKQVRAAGGAIRLLNCDETLYDCLRTTGIADCVEITRKSTPGKNKKVKHG